MRKLLPFICLLLLACTGQKKKRPDDVLDEERFQKLLTELYLLEGEASYRKAQFGENPEKVIPPGTKKIFEEHDLTREQFERSYRYYMEDPERMKKIHDEVLNELMRRKGKEGKEEKGKKD